MRSSDVTERLADDFIQLHISMVCGKFQAAFDRDEKFPFCIKVDKNEGAWIDYILLLFCL